MDRIEVEVVTSTEDSVPIRKVSAAEKEVKTAAVLLAASSFVILLCSSVCTWSPVVWSHLMSLLCKQW